MISLPFKEIMRKLSSRKLHLVKNSNHSQMPLMIYLEAIDYKKGILVVKVNNQSGYQMHYSESYCLYIKSQDGLKLIQKEDSEKETIIEDLKEHYVNIDLRNTILQPADYQFNMGELQCEFTLKK